MISEYDPQQIEAQAHQDWEGTKAFRVTEDLAKEKFYCLAMFPYPSGTLHMGHVRNYTLGDVVARYQRMLGKNVLQPMGWDAFGLPAENAAMKHKVPPAKWTRQNIEYMRSQLQRLGFAYDWKREITTCDPTYYRWEQWFFLELLKKGLVYKRNAVVNWDPVDQTVLANEQVIDGRGWRSGALVERREIPQWFLKITHYADELLSDLDSLTAWPEQVITMQRNWIGHSTGVTITFSVNDSKERLKVFTTRVDTLMGVTYLAIAPEHPLAKQAAEQNPAIQTFVESCSHTKVAEADIATIEKRGIDTGLTAEHPITGDTLPIWIANFVLMEYGSGAVMSVPAHDQRDWEFARRYELPIKQVITPEDNQVCDVDAGAYMPHGILINSAQFSQLTSKEALTKIADFLVQEGKGKLSEHYRLRDWGVSRQRYWGTPIPMIECEECGSVPVPEDDLPVVLPEDIELTGSGSPLKAHADFYHTTCPLCEGEAVRETDTFDTFFESSWYYARFACYDQDKAMLDDRARYWTPVDYYVGGIEHAVMHLLYARFFHKLMRDANLLNSKEPFKQLLTQGMVLKDGAKMSKSKGNTVDPQPLIERYGADTLRLFIIFAAPPEQSLEWSDSGLEGSARFLRRLWQFAQEYSIIKTLNLAKQDDLHPTCDWCDADEDMREMRYELYDILRRCLADYERSQFNTVVSGAMKIFNLLNKLRADTDNPHAQHLLHKGFGKLLRLLTPIIPHITHHLWKTLGYGDDIVNTSLPKISKDALKLDVVEFVVQINGKLRGHIKIPCNTDTDTIETMVGDDADIQRFVADKTIKRTIILLDKKLVNLVVV